MRGSGKSILPLCVDLAHPTPAAGWENRENASFLGRCAGHFDTVMMLAVLHHLLLQQPDPDGPYCQTVQRLTTSHLILEWVPPTDPKFHELRARAASPSTRTSQNPSFREAFAQHFTTIDELTLANGRILTASA